MPDPTDRLKREGRPVDPEFASDERLYRRVVRSDHVGADGYITPAGIPFPDLSVNRGKYSKAEDVLIGHPTAVAIAAARVGDIPARIDDHEFAPVHDPLPENYSHTEIRAFVDGEHVRRKPPKTVRNRFRLAFRLRVIGRSESPHSAP